MIKVGALKQGLKIAIFGVVIAAGMSFPATAHAKSIWAILFPYLVQEDEAEIREKKMEQEAIETLRAPFAGKDDEGAQIDPELWKLYTEDLGINYDAVQLDKPNRYSEQISDWLVRAMSEVFNIPATGSYQEFINHLSTGMTSKALADYRAFVESSHIVETLHSRKLKVHAYVPETPLLLNQGVVSGRYRWLFEMPVTLTFMPQNRDTYENLDPVNQYIIVTTQIGRVPEEEGVDGLIIETLSVRKDPSYEEDN